MSKNNVEIVFNKDGKHIQKIIIELFNIHLKMGSYQKTLDKENKKND